MDADERAKAEARDIDEIQGVVRRVAQRAMGRVYNRARGIQWTATVILARDHGDELTASERGWLRALATMDR